MLSRVSRRYHSPHREERAWSTHQRVLLAASAEFSKLGYSGATIRAIATEADVSVPTVEALFGTKARLLKAAIDVAIAGDDQPVPVLDRDWVGAATRAASVSELLSVVAGVLAPAQARSSGLVLSVFEGAGSDLELADLAAQMSAQRATMAAWIVARLAAHAPLREGIDEEAAVDTVFALMEPALFDRLTRQRGWALARYRDWIARSLEHLLVADAAAGRQRARRDREIEA